MRRLLSAILLVLCGCTTYDLGPEWLPLTEVVERLSLPAVSDTATTTVGTSVYTEDLDQWLLDYPPGSDEFTALMKHEHEHSVRQLAYMGMPEDVAVNLWIARYTTDKKFMWAEEQRGFYPAIKHLHSKGRWNGARTFAQAMGMNEGYRTIGGRRMVSLEEAMNWINDVLQGRWKPSE